MMVYDEVVCNRTYYLVDTAEYARVVSIYESDTGPIVEYIVEDTGKYVTAPMSKFKDRARTAKTGGAFTKQVGGSHYNDMAMQPIEFIMANDLSYCEANIVKYVCRHHAKGGREDIEKVIHYAQMLLEAYDESH